MQHALKDRSRAPALAAVPPEPDHAPPAIHAPIGALGGLAARALADVRRTGLALVRRDPADATPPERATAMLITALEAAGHRATATPRGRIEDVRAPAADELRTDRPFLARPPALVFVQCLRAPGEHDELAVVDARAVFRALERDDARAAELLASVRVRFDDELGARSVAAPMIDRDDFLIRGGPFVLAPGQFTLAAATALGAAHERFSRLLHEHLVRVRLGAGDWLLLDNHRTLHAWSSGAAWSRKAHLDPCARDHA